jgi:hypothetical protein
MTLWGFLVVGSTFCGKWSSGFRRDWNQEVARQQDTDTIPYRPEWPQHFGVPIQKLDASGDSGAIRTAKYAMRANYAPNEGTMNLDER